MRAWESITYRIPLSSFCCGNQCSKTQSIRFPAFPVIILWLFIFIYPNQCISLTKTYPSLRVGQTNQNPKTVAKSHDQTANFVSHSAFSAPIPVFFSARWHPPIKCRLALQQRPDRLQISLAIPAFSARCVLFLIISAGGQTSSVSGNLFNINRFDQSGHRFNRKSIF